jgi:hypothetical protein
MVLANGTNINFAVPRAYGRPSVTRIPALAILAAGVALAVAGFFLIGFACRFTFISTIMTGRIKLPGIWYWLPYKWVLAAAVYLILNALYVWMRHKRTPSPAVTPWADSLLFAFLGVGVATIGFLQLDYPCPYAIDLWLLLELEAPLGSVGIPYKWILTLAACLLLYAAYVRAMQKRANDAR